MTEFRGRPAYLQLADDLRERIRSGKLASGVALPSTQVLIDDTGTSSTVVKNAVSLLRSEGYVVGHQGKGVFAQFPPRLADHSQGAADWALPVLRAGIEMEDALRDLLANAEADADATRAALEHWRAAFDALPASVKSRLSEVQ
ncbi:GntR family transcriptional regulator [Streptomyces sp. H10-C2]|uniref:winged helix-turn-helix domain-containing protein n=1 Tax=unclassified Streptomyces TaxID=2593676 RepID=UPI0024B94CB2|nr:MULTISPECIES: GntR family transcriptional regulator [unclassified Streptomyces]MDJ0341372.1 GntR family transcriptional regulator [Streptomyces sp. PH10-H1]MDJ0370967.1 GntR family transcriptional regulator [Streptomyces sp. H10-C2]